MYPVLLTIHVLSATIWTGGHLVLFFRVLLPTLKSRDVEDLKKFEKQYEVIGIPALLLLVISGLAMAWQMLPNLSEWFSAQTPLSRTVILKLVYLFLTAAMAVHARLRVIPKLSEKNLKSLAVHVAVVTLLGILFVITGVYNRFGGVW